MNEFSLLPLVVVDVVDVVVVADVMTTIFRIDLVGKILTMRNVRYVYGTDDVFVARARIMRQKAVE